MPSDPPEENPWLESAKEIKEVLDYVSKERPIGAVTRHRITKLLKEYLTIMEDCI